MSTSSLKFPDKQCSQTNKMQAYGYYKKIKKTTTFTIFWIKIVTWIAGTDNSRTDMWPAHQFRVGLLTMLHLFALVLECLSL